MVFARRRFCHAGCEARCNGCRSVCDEMLSFVRGEIIRVGFFPKRRNAEDALWDEGVKVLPFLTKCGCRIPALEDADTAGIIVNSAFMA